jgi:hypothetical protein
MQYYIVYDLEIVEEIISKDDEQNTHIDLEDSEESSSSRNSSSDINGDFMNKKSTDKITQIILLSVVWYAKLKSGRKVEYYDVRDEEDFMVNWLKSLKEVVTEIECNNRYDCVNYNMNKIMNYVLVLGYNSSRFDMNFLINILHDQPNHNVESIIGNLIYFKQMTVRTGNWIYITHRQKLWTAL